MDVACRVTNVCVCVVKEKVRPCATCEANATVSPSFSQVGDRYARRQGLATIVALAVRRGDMESRYHGEGVPICATQDHRQQRQVHIQGLFSHDRKN